ncbi:MAG: 5-(carboxyamino)imidazole ribonucleotide synthase [SAR202 cluster bacterium]|nr:5-(carboxyamino)imidazole ribonucleotide synthase [SAR202 cluster bacterium]
MKFEDPNSVIPLGSTLGMLGGGQIGGFFAEAALRFGYKVAVWDPSPNAPAKRFATVSFDSPFDDPATLREFADVSDCASLEWENVPVALTDGLEKLIRVRPGSRSLGLAQDRTKEKGFLTDHRIPVTNYAVIENPSELGAVQLELPWIVKTATLGYDGHGQWRVSNSQEIAETEKVLKGDGPWVVEQVVSYRIELSVVVGYDGNAGFESFPPTENIHENGILRISISPGRISEEIARRAQDLAKDVVKNIGEPGVFCVEMFLLENEDLLVNEIAPRPHNSGHHTIDSFTVSQYELQIRALVGLPLVTPQQITPSVLLNVLGEEYTQLTDAKTTDWIAENRNARIYSYGKPDVRPGRKMGHILFNGPSQEDLLSAALETHKMLAKG